MEAKHVLSERSYAQLMNDDDDFCCDTFKRLLKLSKDVCRAALMLWVNRPVHSMTVALKDRQLHSYDPNSFIDRIHMLNCAFDLDPTTLRPSDYMGDSVDADEVAAFVDPDYLNLHAMVHCESFLKDCTLLYTVGQTLFKTLSDLRLAAVSPSSLTVTVNRLEFNLNRCLVNAIDTGTLGITLAAILYDVQNEHVSLTSALERARPDPPIFDLGWPYNKMEEQQQSGSIPRELLND